MSIDSLKEDVFHSSDANFSSEEVTVSDTEDMKFLKQEVRMLRQSVQMLLRERAAEQKVMEREAAADQKQRKRAHTPTIFFRGAGTALILAPICFVSLQFLRKILDYFLCHLLNLSLETVLLYGGAAVIGLFLLCCATPLAEWLCWEEDDEEFIDMEE